MTIDLPSIYHRSGDNYCYLLDESTLQIRIRTKKDNIDQIELIYGDQYEISDYRWNTHRIEMKKVGNDSLFDYWQGTLVNQKRVRYGFTLFSNYDHITYTEKGFFPFVPENPGFYFCMPYLHKKDVFTPPSWVHQTIWYQIFPERFRNGDSSLNPNATIAWGQEEPSYDNFFGGDIQGIIDALDYLQDLGINGIYLTPVFHAKSNHKYDTIDYLQIDPQFGDTAMVKKLVEECHKRHIRVMLDAVFNHCGYEFPPFQDVIDNGESSRYKDWFHIHHFPLKEKENLTYDTFGFYEQMPKFNTANHEVKEYLLHVAKHWIIECNIDGWRLDVANEIDHDFWREFRTVVKKLKPDLFILGEVWHDSLPWLRGDQFDSTMNYPFLTKALQFFAYDMITAVQFTNEMTTNYYAYPTPINQVLFNILGSHDTPRILHECSYRKERVKLLFTFLLTHPGSPCIYYGDEVGLGGGSDPGCRKCMPWDDNKQDLELKAYIKRLIQVRKQSILFTNNSEFCYLPASNSCIAYLTQTKGEILLTILNKSAEETQYLLPFPLRGKKISLLLTEEEYAAESDDLAVILGPFESSILHFDMNYEFVQVR
ncbi:glycoside hydrolase family 13 protein [Bacillus sp. B1-b2]|uniref:glycoside hydrolase family 13 protein n=1 Tax=Bacillus sp. B1-b2 TaxID=2653201 RepID=UPI00126244CA|nr:glycoside hydrolase family 13 protein [Bacillus sp. B1-b2]KAB7664700.1 alpha-glycosidase [Bacillus sp. B1-b2]